MSVVLGKAGVGWVACRSAQQREELEQKLAGALKAADAASAAKQASAGAVQQCAPLSDERHSPIFI